MRFGRRQIEQAGLSLVLAALCPLASAQSWGLPQLMAGFAEVGESRARYTEEKHVSMLNAPLRLSGTLRYVRPDQLEKSVTQPYVESLRVRGDRVEWQRQNRTRTLSLRSQPQIWALVDSIRATLAGDLPALNQHYWVKFEGDRSQWKITLEPRQENLSQFIETMRLQGSAHQLRRVEIVEANQDRSVMLIEDVRD